MYSVSMYRRLLAIVFVVNLAIPAVGTWQLIAAYNSIQNSPVSVSESIVMLDDQAGMFDDQAGMFDEQAGMFDEQCLPDTGASDLSDTVVATATASESGQMTSSSEPSNGSLNNFLIPNADEDFGQSVASAPLRIGSSESTLSLIVWFYGTLSLLSLVGSWVVFTVLRKKFETDERRREQVRVTATSTAALSQSEFLKYVP